MTARRGWKPSGMPLPVLVPEQRWVVHDMTATQPLTRTPPVMRDPALPHQIVITFTGHNMIAVSCNCRRWGVGYSPLATRSRWDDGEAVAVWQAHMAEVNGGPR